MRNAFSMITAIFLILIMSSLLALVSSLSGKVTKTTTNQYRKAQAALLAESYTEYAILSIQGHNLAAPATCLRTINGMSNLQIDAPMNNADRDSGRGYQVEVKIQYIGINNTPAAARCNPTAVSVFGHRSLGDQTAGAVPTNSPTHLYATIDVYVMYHDLDYVDAQGGAVNNGDVWKTYHRRTLQKL